MIKGQDFYIVDMRAHPAPVDEARRRLLDDGVVALRNLFPVETFSHIRRAVDGILSRPALLGSAGYYRKGHNKRLYDALLLGPTALDISLEPRVLDIVASTMGKECWLAECFVKHDEGNNEFYFPLHADFAPGHPKQLTAEKLKRPVGIGAMLYLHDTTDGAFCYAVGTQNSGREHGTVLSRYPAEFQRSVREKLVRIEGKAGDFVLFDDRGFHGPEQPVSVSRTVIIMDYYEPDAFENMTKTQLPVLASDLGRLSKRQIEWLGLSAKGALIPYERYHVHGFYTQRHYRILSRIVGAMQAADLARSRLKNGLRRWGFGAKPAVSYDE